MALFSLTRVIHDGLKLPPTEPRKRGKNEQWREQSVLDPPLWSRKPSEPPRKADLGSAGLPGVWTGKRTRQLTAPRRRHLPAPTSGHGRFLWRCPETSIASAQPCVRPAAQGSRAERLWLVWGGEGLRARCVHAAAAVGEFVLSSMRSSSQRERVVGSLSSIHHV